MTASHSPALRLPEFDLQFTTSCLFSQNASVQNNISDFVLRMRQHIHVIASLLFTVNFALS